MRRLALPLLMGLIWLLAQGLALAATPSTTGTAVGVNPSAEADLGTVTRTLFIGSDVSVGETVVTGPTGQVQLVFKDETRLVIGPHSSLLIEAYLLRDDQSVGQFAIDALSGTFRFITGKSDKNAYTIKTATGIIGVRGTAFDFTVDPAIGTIVVLFHGAVHLCNLKQICVDLGLSCGVASMQPSGSQLIGPAQQARENLRAQFQYVQSDKSLLAGFRVEKAQGCFMPTTTAAPAHKIVPLIHKAPPTLRSRAPTHHQSVLSGPPVITLSPTLPVYTPPLHLPPPVIKPCPRGTIATMRDGKRICLPVRIGRPILGGNGNDGLLTDQPPATDNPLR